MKMLGSKPLLQYTAEAAKDSRLLSDVIVSTDSEQIATAAKNWGIEVPFIRPSLLATDSATSIDVVCHAVKFLEEQGRVYDAVCLLQPTCPFRVKGFIDEAINKFKVMQADSLISVLPVPPEYNPHWVFVPTDDGSLKLSTGEAEIISRRQDLPTAYYRDGSVYLSKISVIKNSHSFFGNRIAYIKSDPFFYSNIDTQADWTAVENKLIQMLPHLSCAE